MMCACEIRFHVCCIYYCSVSSLLLTLSFVEILSFLKILSQFSLKTWAMCTVSQSSPVATFFNALLDIYRTTSKRGRNPVRVVSSLSALQPVGTCVGTYECRPRDGTMQLEWIPSKSI